MKSLISAVFVAALAIAQPAYAAKFDIDYSSAETGHFSAVLNGDLSSNGKIFNVSGVDSFTFNGSARSNVSVITADYYLGGNYGPSVALNGSFIDLYFTNPYYLVVIAVGDIQATKLAGTSVGAGGGVGSEIDNKFHPFLAANYTGRLEASSDVPESATWALMTIGFGLVGTSLRGRGAALCHQPAQSR